MPFRPLHRVLLVAVLAPLLAGCLYSREIAHTTRALESDLPGASFDRQVVISLGPGALRLAGWITGLVDRTDADLQAARDMLHDVRRVKVGVYHAAFRDGLDAVELPERLRRVLEREGWTMALRVAEDDAFVWLYYRERRGTVRDLYAVVLGDGELVIARLKGRLDRVLARVMEEYAPDERRADSDGGAYSKLDKNATMSRN